MRPSGRGPLDSLYFAYPDFPALTCAELDGTRLPNQVANKIALAKM